MATLYTVRGPGNQFLGEPTLQAVNRFTNTRLVSQDNNKIVIEGNLTYEGETKKYSTTYFIADNKRMSRMESSSESTSGVVSGELFQADELFERADAVNEGTLSVEEYIGWAYKGTDVIDGSSEGGSLRGWTHGGDDHIYLHAGDNNYINSGDGNDYIQNFNPLAGGAYQGGSGNDRIAVANGQAWGGLGQDFFHLIPIWDENAIYSYAQVMDYEIGVDTIYAEAPVYYDISEAGVWLSAGDAFPSMLVKNVYDINQLTIVENLA